MKYKIKPVNYMYQKILIRFIILATKLMSDEWKASENLIWALKNMWSVMNNKELEFLLLLINTQKSRYFT